ncbi:uncharacterized protein IL334_007798 [Kwoniella shivajii]|uniref:Uncharacterized protein n=1 Tax=Kwoniella shivajii TaxID=564305 RepID=A0ABZ1DBH4_9TREE|nr:hypothetical protein IL334_007798 [Kwoniella shivajii]
MAYSPPLPLLLLAPPLSSNHSHPGSRSDVSDESTRSTSLNTTALPPSSYNRGTHSVEHLLSLPLLARSFDPRRDGKGVNRHIFQGSHTSSVPSLISKMSTTPQAPPKKPGFFRRMSLSSSQTRPEIRPSLASNGSSGLLNRNSGRSVSGSHHRDDMVAGPSYETLSPGAAPGTFRNSSNRPPATAHVNGKYLERAPMFGQCE